MLSYIKKLYINLMIVARQPNACAVALAFAVRLPNFIPRYHFHEYLLNTLLIGYALSFLSVSRKVVI